MTRRYFAIFAKVFLLFFAKSLPQQGLQAPAQPASLSKHFAKKITSLFETLCKKSHKSFRKTLQKTQVFSKDFAKKNTSLFERLCKKSQVFFPKHLAKILWRKKKKRDFARKQAKTLPPNTPPSSSQAKARSLWGYWLYNNVFIKEKTFCIGGRNVHLMKNEQINGTRAKSQQIVVQDYFHAYNTPFLI